MARDTEKRVGRENKTQEGTYRHAFPSKGCRETERTERGVSNCVPRSAEDSGQQRGASDSQSWQKVSCEAQPAQAEPWELRQTQLSWEAHAKQQPSRAMGEHGAIPNLAGMWARRGKRTSHQHRQQGEGLGKTARSNRQLVGRAAWQRLLQIIQDSLVSLGEAFVPGEVSSKQGLSSYVPSWVGERGEDT